MYKKSFALGILLVLFGLMLLLGPRVAPANPEVVAASLVADRLAMESAPPLWFAFGGGLSMAAGFALIAFGIGRWEEWSKSGGDPRV